MTAWAASSRQTRSASRPQRRLGPCGCVAGGCSPPASRWQSLLWSRSSSPRGAGTPEPPSLRVAVADFSAQRLPGAQLPEQRALDLSQLQLQPIGAGGGTYAELDLDGYAYRDSAGRRVVLYLSDKPSPEAPGAELLAGPDGPRVAHRGDVVVLCARVPLALLLVVQGDELVRSVGSALGVL